MEMGKNVRKKALIYLNWGKPNRYKDWAVFPMYDDGLAVNKDLVI